MGVAMAVATTAISSTTTTTTATTRQVDRKTTFKRITTTEIKTQSTGPSHALTSHSVSAY